ncbi:kinase-like domain-containing protein [Aspergillus egyptiacus]|nr:kinase-like domain-containing protein [Aspergillus egyptiacus]
MGRLGNGSSATVWQERCVSGPSSNTVRAVKQLRKQHSSFLEMSRRELEALTTFSNSQILGYKEHFVQFLGWFDDPEYLYIAMEFVQYGDLQKFITAPFPEPEAASIVTQVARALQYMHRKNFVHRDIKPLNILVQSPRPHWHVKVADFGITKRTDGTVLGTHGIGSPGYMAPELYGNASNAYTAAVDVWALGAVTFCLRTCSPPFPTVRDLLDYARDHRIGIPLKRLGRSSGFCVDFVRGALAEVPERRLTIAHVLAHDWLCGEAGSSGLGEQTESSAPFTISPLSDWPETTESTGSVEPRTPSSNRPTMEEKSGFLSLYSRLPGIGDSSQEGLSLETRDHLGVALGEQGASTNIIRNKPAGPRAGTIGMLTTMASLASMYRKQKRYARAEAVAEDVVNLQREAFGSEHPDTIAALSGLAATYREQGKYQLLDDIDKEILELRQGVLGPRHPDTIQAMRTLSATYSAQGKSQQSEIINEEILQFNRDILGDKHPDTIHAMANLATAYVEQDKFDKAESIYTELFFLQREAPEGESLLAVQWLENLSRIHYKQGKGLNSADPNVRVKIVAGHNFGKHTYRKIPNPFVIATMGSKEVYRTSPVEKAESPEWNEAFEIKVNKDSALFFRGHDDRRTYKSDRGYLGMVRVHVGPYMSLEEGAQVEQKYMFTERTEYVDSRGSLTINIASVKPKRLPQPFTQDGLLPGWEMFKAENGKFYYIDYNKKRITLTRPKRTVKSGLSKLSDQSTNNKTIKR